MHGRLIVAPIFLVIGRVKTTPPMRLRAIKIAPTYIFVGRQSRLPLLKYILYRNVQIEFFENHRLKLVLPMRRRCAWQLKYHLNN